MSEIEVEYGEFKRAVGVIIDCELVTELLDGIAHQYEKCHCLLDEVRRKLFNDPRENDVEDVVPSDSVSHVDYYSTTSSKMLTASRRIEFKRKRLELKARHDLELAKAQTEAHFLIEQANLEAEEEFASLCGHGSLTTNSRRVRHNDTTKRVTVYVKKNSYSLTRVLSWWKIMPV